MMYVCVGETHVYTWTVHAHPLCQSYYGCPNGMTKHGSTGHHSCSNQASATDSMGPVIDDLKRLEEGIPMFVAYLQQEVLVVAPVMAWLCDKPRHSELLVMLEVA